MQLEGFLISYDVAYLLSLALRILSLLERYVLSLDHSRNLEFGIVLLLETDSRSSGLTGHRPKEQSH